MREVVGVVADVRMDFRAEFVPIMYVPYQQHLTDYAGNNQLAVHTIKILRALRHLRCDDARRCAGVCRGRSASRRLAA